MKEDFKDLFIKIVIVMAIMWIPLMGYLIMIVDMEKKLDRRIEKIEGNLEEFWKYPEVKKPEVVNEDNTKSGN